MRVFCLTILMLLTCAMTNAAYADETKDKSCQAYAQAFYDWYVKISQNVRGETPTSAVFKNKKFEFSKELQSQLKEDEAVARLFPGEIVGLDFDPFLNSQDLPEKFTAGKVNVAGAKYHVDMFGTLEGKKSKKPDVIPELISENGHWVFVNFLYPGATDPTNRDLLSVLKQLKKDRPPLPSTKSKSSSPASKAPATSNSKAGKAR